MRVLITADWHISGTRPICRIDDDWIGAQGRDIDSVWDIADANNVDAIWILGDLFDQSRVSTEAVNLVLRKFKEAPAPIYILCGNHDLPYHRFSELERSSIGTVLHQYPMLCTDNALGLVAYPFGMESEDIGEMNMRIWATHQLTFPGNAARPIPGIGVLAQELLDKCPAAKVILTGDYHHGYVYVGSDGRKVITPGCLNIRAADMADYQPRVYILDTNTYDVQKGDIPVQGEIITTYLSEKRAYDSMKEQFLSSLTGEIKMKSFAEALEENAAPLSEGVRDILAEVKEMVGAV